MKKTHWLRNTLIILLVCALAGGILSVIQFRRENNRTYVSAVLTFSFDGAQDGKAPNGYAFSPVELASETVVAEALAAAGLTDKYEAEEIQRNLFVQGNYPENLLERLGSYDSVIGENAATSVALTSYYPTAFTVRLYNDFDPSLNQEGMKALLGNLIDAYRARFAKTGTWAKVSFLTAEDLENYDYFQQLDMLQLRLEQIRDYAVQLAEEDPILRLEGKGFSDWAAQLDGLIAGDLSRASASVTTNALSKDVDRLQQQYLFMINQLTNEAASETQRLNKLNELIATYAKTGVIYLSTSQSLNRVDRVSSRYYDQLSDLRNEVSANIAGINAQITNYQNRLKELNAGTEKAAAAKETAGPADGTEETAEETAETAAAAQSAPQTAEDKEAAIASLDRMLSRVVTRGTELTEKLNGLIDLLNEEKLGDAGLQVSAARYQAPSLISGSFAVKLIKTAAPLCSVGLMIALAGLIISRRKEEKSLKIKAASPAAENEV